MKSVILAAILTVSATQTLAATVRGARLDASQKNVIIDVTYGGGCGVHQFSLNFKGCFESFPVQCQADLIEKTNDHCEALVSNSVVINLAEAGIKGSYFSQGSLTIRGDHDWQTKKPSQATVRLPKMN